MTLFKRDAPYYAAIGRIVFLGMVIASLVPGPWSLDSLLVGFMLSALFVDGLLASFKPRRLVWLLTAKNTVINGRAN